MDKWNKDRLRKFAVYCKNEIECVTHTNINATFLCSLYLALCLVIIILLPAKAIRLDNISQVMCSVLVCSFGLFVGFNYRSIKKGLFCVVRVDTV